ncbi:claudin-1 [Thalassophryne amazonica]|uniref:claudin-1 n=1 Tax=Thalassophryne amazonica TaxID=390379 RepID=UPI001472503B|nr:claudin-1 [Thalassophryne amazonica]
MANVGLQLLGFVLAFLGFIGSVVATVMVEWKASSYAGDNIITAQAMYEGLWKTCAMQSTGNIVCQVYNSILQLPAIVVGTRGLMLADILVCFVAIIVATVGMKCTTCLSNEPELKSKVALAGGILFIIAGLLALVGTCWYGHRIAQDFYNPFTPTNARFEFGSALFIGWGAACTIIIGGAFICCSHPRKNSGRPHNTPSRSTGQPGKDYV